MANEPNSQDRQKKEEPSEEEQLIVELRPLFKHIKDLTKAEPFNYPAFITAIISFGILVLVALPLGAVWISSNSDCCFNYSVSDQLTFWAAMLGGFLAFFGIIISGIFVVFAFRIDHGAKNESVKFAMDAVIQFLNANPKRTIAEFRDIIEKIYRDFDSCAKATKEDICKKKSEIDDAMKKINESINEFKSKLKELNAEADEIEKSHLPELKTKLAQAKQDIDKEIPQIVAGMQASSEAAIERIDKLVASVEQASEAALRRLQPPGNRETDEDSGN